MDAAELFASIYKTIAAASQRIMSVMKNGAWSGRAWLSEEVKFIADNKESLEESATLAREVGQLKRSAYAALHYLFKAADKDKCREFFDLLRTGSGLRDGHPVLALRNQLVFNPAVEKRAKSRHDTRAAALTIVAWNKFVSGESLSRFRWNDSGKFPEIAS